MKAQRNIDQLRQQRMNPQDTEAADGSESEGPAGLQPLLDRAYRNYQTDADNLRRVRPTSSRTWSTATL